MKTFVACIGVAFVSLSASGRGIDCTVNNLYKIDERGELIAEARDVSVVELRNPNEIKSMRFAFPDASEFVIHDPFRDGAESQYAYQYQGRMIVKALLKSINIWQKPKIEFQAPGRTQLRHWNAGNVSVVAVPARMNNNLPNQIEVDGRHSMNIARLTNIGYADSFLVQEVTITNIKYNDFVKIEHKMTFSCAPAQSDTNLVQRTYRRLRAQLTGTAQNGAAADGQDDSDRTTPRGDVQTASPGTSQAGVASQQ
jgi:hypothetical protein